MGSPNLKPNGCDISGDVRQKQHEIGVAEARLMLAGKGDEFVTAMIRFEVGLGDDDTRRHGTSTGIAAMVHGL